MTTRQSVTLSVLLIILSYSSSAQSFKNKNFKPSIHTVQLFNEATQSTFPLINLNSQQKLTLRFDDLADEVKEYSYTLIHCNENWVQSDLFPNDYLTGFEEEQITNYEYSVNTAVNYIHYSISFPNSNLQINKSGNYLLIVFEDFDRSKIVLTKKFYVTSTLVEITPFPSTSVDFEHRYTHHEIDFNIDYSILDCDDPFREISVVVMQNNRQDNCIRGLQPTFVKEKVLMYNSDAANRIEAGNEYRIFDTRDLANNGRNVQQTVVFEKKYHIILFEDQKRAYKKYTKVFDNNGNFYPSTKQYASPYTETDYTYVHFRLPYKKELSEGGVYINGELSNHELNLNNRMIYRDSLNRYEAELLLKQGVYDYSYVYKPNDSSTGLWETLEGSHYETENLYTILVYFKSFNDNAQQLIGVKRFVYQ